MTDNNRIYFFVEEAIMNVIDELFDQKTQTQPERSQMAQDASGKAEKGLPLE